MKNSARLTFAKFIVTALLVAGSFNLSHAALPGGGSINLPGDQDGTVKTEMLPGGGSINLPGDQDSTLKMELTPGGGIVLPGDQD